MKLSPEAVRHIMRDALFTEKECPDGKPPATAKIVEGIVRHYAFHPERLAAHKDEIDGLLKQLPDNFHLGLGGGWTFLNACDDREGHQWGEHPDMEALFCLGVGVGSASWLMRDLMNILPGNVPYVQVHVGKKPEEEPSKAA